VSVRAAQSPPGHEHDQRDDDQAGSDDAHAAVDVSSAGDQVAANCHLVDELAAPFTRAAYVETQDRSLHPVPTGMQPDRHPDPPGEHKRRPVHDAAQSVARKPHRRDPVGGGVSEADKMALNPTASQGRLNSAIRPQRISTRNITSWKGALAVRMPSVLMSPPTSGRAPSRRMAPSAHPTRKIPAQASTQMPKPTSSSRGAPARRLNPRRILSRQPCTIATRERMAKSTTTLLVLAFPCPQYIHTTKLLKRVRVAKPKPNNTRSTFGLSFIALPKILSFLSFGSYGHFK
jgi:hypothetical protein